MLTIKIDINEDIEFRINKYTNKKNTLSKVIQKILQDWADSEDDKDYEKSTPGKTKNVSHNISKVEDFDFNILTLKDLQDAVQSWICEHGEDAILENSSKQSNKYRLIK